MEGSAEVKSKVMDKVVALAVKLEEEVSAGDEDVRAWLCISMRKRDAPVGNFNKRATSLLSLLLAAGQIGQPNTIRLVSDI